MTPAYRVVWSIGEHSGTFPTNDGAQAQSVFEDLRAVLEERPGQGWVSLNRPPCVLRVYPPFKPDAWRAA